MTYSDAIYFVGKCLTLDHYPDRIAEVREKIRSGAVVWEQVVWVSTGQFVFPALYLQLKRAGLLAELPPDLVEYMEEFTDLNRKRNEQIIEHALEITALFNESGISPLFLKGTAYLLDGLYTDVAERMVGDIDILVGEDNLLRVAEILINSGYTTEGKIYAMDSKHSAEYFPLIHEKWPQAVDLHSQILRFPYYKAVESRSLINRSKKLDCEGSACILNPEDQLVHNILNVQINDFGHYYAGIFLRQGYDLLLMSQRVDPLSVVKKFGRLYNLMNTNLALTSKIMDHPSSITYTPDWRTRLYLLRVKRHLRYPGWGKFSRFIFYVFWRLSNHTKLLIRLVYDPVIWKYFFSRLSDPAWYRAHLKSYK